MSATKSKAFLICPVRGIDKATQESTVTEIEKYHDLHWPPRDTRQDGDPTGFRICNDNLSAIKEADVVYLIWDGKSQGVLFDAGMAFALEKKVKVIELPAASEGKSFQNMFREWSGE